ncbi:MAG: flagellar M-ring protein FliF [Chthonomonas sp.]|nr:flagellar M-ring protein FliF [Chthonomonas sp.]
MVSFLEQIKAWWLGLDRTQRPIWILGGGLLTALLVVAFMLSSRPSMSLLFGGLSPADQGMVVQELNKMGISAEYDTNGNVLVPGNKVSEARAKLAVAKKLPQGGNLGYGALDNMNSMMVSPEVEKVKIKAAMEGDLANSIQMMSGISAAKVTLTLPDNTPFAAEQKPAGASIVVTQDGGVSLSAEQAQAIVRLVQFGVSGLGAERIVVMNDRGQRLYDGAEATGINASADKKVQAEIAEARRREQELQAKLDAAFGVGNTIVSIPMINLNFDKIHENSVIKQPTPKPVSIDTTEETMADANGSSAMGAAGTTSNLQAPAEGSSTDKKSYSGTTKSATYDMNVTEKSIERSAGVLEGMTLSVLVNSANITDTAPVEEYIQNYLGPLSQQTDKFKASVTSTAFDKTATEGMKAAQSGAASRNITQQLMAILPIAALILVGFLITKAISKATPRPGQATAVALPGGGTLSLPPGALNGDPNQLIALEGADIANALNTRAVQNSEPPVPIEDIPDKVNVPLEQIKKMASTRPETVASLLKTWMLEETR